jgi:hypothetical protein
MSLIADQAAMPTPSILYQTEKAKGWMLTRTSTRFLNIDNDLLISVDSYVQDIFK